MEVAHDIGLGVNWRRIGITLSLLLELMLEALRNGTAPEEVRTGKWVLFTSADLPNPPEASSR